MVGFCLLMSAAQWSIMRCEAAYVSSVVREIIETARPADKRATVLALRDYLRRHVNYEGLPKEGRPFLRASAASTLRSGKGYCGEVARTFIVMAETAGIRSQRINLTGDVNHVVAEAELGPGDEVIVDATHPPYVKDLAPLDKVIGRPEFSDYYTVNLRRLHLYGIVSRVKLHNGVITRWLEDPHGMKATLWLLAGLLLAAKRGLRTWLRWFLHRRGWRHESTLDKLGYERRPK
ncbi:MAG: transglutaminase domain-containing protein [Elusimicrobia bacterium]|nr:transglutaminase domain-containing protein [Elusimicrobiota bacterium]